MFGSGEVGGWVGGMTEGGTGGKGERIGGINTSFSGFAVVCMKDKNRRENSRWVPSKSLYWGANLSKKNSRETEKR